MLIALLGLIAGLAIGMTGVGGGSLTVPLLTIVAGLPVSDSVGAALVFSTIVKSFATSRFYFRKNIDGPVFRRLLTGGLPGVLLGSLLMQHTVRHMAAAGSNQRMLTIVGAIIALTAGLSLYRTIVNLPPFPRPAAFISLIACIIGLETGFSSAGAGALGTVLLFNATTLPPATVIGTDMAFGLALSFAGGLVNLYAGNWRPEVLAPLAAGGLAGAFLGSALAGKVPAGALRRITLAAVTLLGLALLWKGL